MEHAGKEKKKVKEAKMVKLADKAGGAARRGVGETENVETWLGLADTWRHFAMDFHYAGLDLFASDLFACAIRRLPKGDHKAPGEGGEGTTAKGHVAELAKHTASLEFWLDAANVAFKGGDAAEAEKLCRVAQAQYPDSKRAKKAVKMLEKGKGKGGFDKAGSLKYMRKKGLAELMGLVKESAPLTVLEEKVREMKEGGGGGEGGERETEEVRDVEEEIKVEEARPKKKKKAGFRRESQGLIEVKTYEG